MMLCDKLIIEQEIDCTDLSAGFVWVEGKRVRQVLPSYKGAVAH